MDLTLYAFTGSFPFNKGAIGGFFNDGSVAAAVHHGACNLDVGGSHVGYVPGNGGGRFGQLWRPHKQHLSTNCGYLSSLITPFQEVYQDACANIFIQDCGEELLLVSIPNEFVQPEWSSQRIKLQVELNALIRGPVFYRSEDPHTHPPVDRSLFFLHPSFLAGLDEATRREVSSSRPTRIGSLLAPPYFRIFETGTAPLDDRMPARRLLLYIREIVAATDCPPILKACIVNTCLEHNHLSDTSRLPAFRDNSFVSFTGLFIDLFDEPTRTYRNLFQPVALTIKPSGTVRERILTHEELRTRLKAVTGIRPKVDLGLALGEADRDRLTSLFTFRPGYFQES